MSHLTAINVQPDSHALTTLDAVKLALGITDTNSDDLLSAYIARASGVIESYLGRPILEQTVTETWRESSWKQRDFLLICYPPITSLISLIENTVPLVQDTDFEVEVSTGTLYRTVDGFRYRWGYEVITQYVGGWTTVPVAVEQVCIDMVYYAHHTSTQNPGIQLELTEGVGRIAYFNRGLATFILDDTMKMLLQPYAAIIP